MKLINIFISGLATGIIIGYFSNQPFHIYKPETIHDTINRRVDSIIKVENTIYKTIEKTKQVYVYKKDSIIRLPDSFQFDLFRSNCERYQYLYSNDSATQNF